MAPPRRALLLGLATLSAGGLLAAAPPRPAPGMDAVVHDCRGLRAALLAAAPGGVVALTPGDYLDDRRERLVLAADGVVLRAAAGAGPGVRAADPRRPVLRVPLVVRGDGVRIEGLAFADPPAAAAAPSHELDGDELAMLGELALEEGLPAAALRRVLGPTKLRIAGAGVEVAGCEFFGTRGIAITVLGPARAPHVHDCYFHDPLGDDVANGAIQVGVGMATTNTRIGALVERNLFERWASGNETISVKSSGNTVRGNVLVDCRNVTNRHGEDNVYEGNALERSGWITVFDRGTRVLRNRVAGGRGIRVMAGDIPSDAVVQGGQPQARDTFLEGNTGLLVVGFRFGSDRLPAVGTVVASHDGPVELRPGGQVDTVLLPAPA